MTDVRGVGGARQPQPGPPRTRSKRHSVLSLTAVAVGVLAALGVGALVAGPPESAGDQQGEPRTLQESMERLAELRRSQRIAAQAPPGTALMPVIVGMTYQQAQRLCRSLGLTPAAPVDATGAGREPQVLTRWIVLRQTPTAGSVVHPGDPVTATVAKADDYRWGRPTPDRVKR